MKQNIFYKHSKLNTKISKSVHNSNHHSTYGFIEGNHAELKSVSVSKSIWLE